MLYLRATQIANSVLFFALSIIFAMMIFDYFVSPVTLTGITILDAVPDRIRYSAEYDRTTACSSQVERFIFQSVDGHLIFYFRDVSPAYGYDVGKHRIQDDIVLDPRPPLAEGEYKLEIRLVSRCTIITRVDAYPIVNVKIGYKLKD